jgi:hypothetical protein
VARADAQRFFADRRVVRFFALFCLGLGGTFAPLARASLMPIAIACLRLVTFWPELLLSVPFFLRRMADVMVFSAAFPYFAT